MIDRRKRNKILREVKPAENINKNLQSFVEINLMQEEFLPSHYLQDHVYE